MKTCDGEGDGWSTRLGCSNEHLGKWWSTIDELENGTSKIHLMRISVLVTAIIRSVRKWPYIHYEATFDEQSS